MISGKHANQIYFKLFVNFHLTFLSMRWHFILILKMYAPCVLKICESSYSVIQFSSVAQSCPTLCNPMDCNWVLFLLWLCPFILSGVISPLISTSILGTYWPREFIFQCPIFLPFHTVHGVLKARILKWFAIPFSSGPHSVRPLHHDPAVLGGPTQHGLVSLS